MKTKTRHLILPSLALLAAGLLAAPAAAQVGNDPNEPSDPGAGGGTWHGPGDTRPDGLGSGGNQPGSQPGSGTNPWGGSITSAPGSNVQSSIPVHVLFAGPESGEDLTTPESRPIVSNPDSWEMWWHYNRWAHLESDAHAEILATTGMQGFFLGRGEKQEMTGDARATEEQIQDIVFPALAEAIDRGGSSEIVIHSLQALAKLHVLDSREAVDDFRSLAVRTLKSGNQNVVEKAILSLGIQGDRRFVTWLAAILRDEPLAHDLLGRDSLGPRIRAFAAYALGILAERNESPFLRRRIQAELGLALAERRAEIQAAALLATGLNLLPIELEVMDDGLEVGTRVDQVMRVLEFFEETDHDLVARSQAPNALARLVRGAPESLRTRVAHSLLVAIGTHSKESREVQEAAVLALGAIGCSGTEPIDQEIRKELARVAYKSSAHRLTRYMAMVSLATAASRPSDEEKAYSGLIPTRRLLLKQLRSSRGQGLAWTALALGLLEEHSALRGEAPSPKVASNLRNAFEANRSPEVAGALALALGMLKDREAKPILLDRMLTTGHAQIRGYSALALGMLGERDTIQPLRDVLEDSLNQPFTLHQVAIGLALLGDGTTGSRLLELFLDASNPRSRASLAAAMGWAQDPGSLSRLCALVTDERFSTPARAWTAVAIGRICDEDAWPWVGRLSVGVQYDVSLPTLIEPRFQTGLLDQP